MIKYLVENLEYLASKVVFYECMNSILVIQSDGYCYCSCEKFVVVQIILVMKVTVIFSDSVITIHLLMLLILKKLSTNQLIYLNCK